MYMYISLRKPELEQLLKAQYFLSSVFKRFSLLNQEAVDKDKNAKLKRDEILELPELKVNFL